MHITKAMAHTDVVDLSRPVFHTPDGVAKFAVWGRRPAGRVGVVRYVTRTEAHAEIAAGTVAIAAHEAPPDGRKPNKLSGAYLTALARR